ncbi:MAG: DUF2279 domain-containing protein [Bacteroidetes bacterium]|nr:DUF2279 domain-containing protein [Bacteroidota bacterium]
MRLAWLLIFTSIIQLSAAAQNDSSFRKRQALNFFQPSPDFNKQRLAIVVGTEAVGAIGSLVILDQLWYANYPHSAFHLFNDNDEWLGMDKFGHSQTGYSVGQSGYKALRWAGVNEKKSLLWGGTLGFMYLTVIEVMDGLSAQWGFSPGDFVADAGGAALFIGEQLLWKEQRIAYKWSFMPSPYAQYRPNLLGKDLSQQWLKDYNGQTYWFSVNIASFLPETKKFPQWLNLAIGYGADGMTGGSSNPTIVNGKTIPTFERRSQYYLSLDFDLTKIKTKHRFLKTVFNTFGFLKIPAPTVEFTPGKGTYFHWLYF